MGRHYLKVQVAIVDHEKYLDATWSARASHLELLCRAASTEGTLRSRRHAVQLLRRAGCPDGEADVAELLRLRLLDEQADGALVIHDWPDWQGTYRGPSDEPEAAAERKRRQRARERTGSAVTNGHEVSRGVTNGHEPTVTDTTEESRGEEIQGDSGEERERAPVGAPPLALRDRHVTNGHEVSPADADEGEVLAHVQQLMRREAPVAVPTEVRGQLRAAIRGHGRDEVIRAIDRAAMTSGPLVDWVRQVWWPAKDLLTPLPHRPDTRLGGKGYQPDMEAIDRAINRA
jgi:hypothetical protein